MTIFGESAGSKSVSMQLMYPPNKGLFRSAIAQSGALGLPGAFLENNIEIAKYYAQNMSSSTETIDEVFQCLKEASSEQIIKVFQDAVESGGLRSATKVGANN